MLNVLRKRGNLKKIMWGLAILIIPAFVLWGSGSSIRSSGLPKYAGEIFGKRISFRQYEASFQAARREALLIYGEDFNKVAKFLNLEKEAWQRLILLYQAKKERIKVSDEEVINFIQKLPFFQKEGRFSQERYNVFLDYAFRISPRDFEEQIRETLKIDQLKNKFISKVKLSDEETEKVYKNENEKAKVFYVFLDPQKFTEGIHPSYEQLEDYYQGRMAEFKEPAQVNVEYIALYFDRDRPKIDISEEEIQSYYQEHPEQFPVKDKTDEENIESLEEVRTQIKERLTQEKVKVVLEDRIWQISDDITEDPLSFEETAKKNHLEVNRTGFFGPQQFIPEIGLCYEFLNAAFSLEIGQVSNAIETPKGYFIIKMKEKKETYIPPLEEVKEKVEKALIKQKSWQLANNKGEELLSQIKKFVEEKKINFSKAAEKLSLAVKETERFTRSNYIAGIGQSPEFSQAAFALKPGEISDLIIVPNGYCILSLKNIIPVDQEEFAREKEEFSKKLLARKKETFYQIWLAKLKRDANLVNNIEKLRKKQSAP